jgi:hypothetical protein
MSLSYVNYEKQVCSLLSHKLTQVRLIYCGRTLTFESSSDVILVSFSHRINLYLNIYLMCFPFTVLYFQFVRTNDRINNIYNEVNFK